MSISLEAHPQRPVDNSIANPPPGKSRFVSIKEHLPSIKTISILAIKIFLLIGVIIFTIYCPYISIGLCIGSFIAYRVLMEYTQYKFDASFRKQNLNPEENTLEAHSRMLKSVLIMQRIAKSRHVIQFASIASLVVFWHVKAPLIILGATVAAAVLVVDYLDSKSCIKSLKLQVARKIHHNTSLLRPEKERILYCYLQHGGHPTAQPLDEQQIAQKCELERKYRNLAREFQEKINKRTAEAYAYMILHNYCTPEEAPDPDIFTKLPRLVIFRSLQEEVDYRNYIKSPSLKYWQCLFQSAKQSFCLLDKDQRRILKEKILNPEAYEDCHPKIQDCFLKICSCETGVQKSAIREGLEIYYLKTLRLHKYLEKMTEEYWSLLTNCGEDSQPPLKKKKSYLPPSSATSSAA